MMILCRFCIGTFFLHFTQYASITDVLTTSVLAADVLVMPASPKGGETCFGLGIGGVEAAGGCLGSTNSVGMNDSLNEVTSLVGCCDSLNGRRAAAEVWLACSRAVAKAWTLAKRWRGSFASAVSITCSTAGGMLGTFWRKGGGGAITCWVHSSMNEP